MLNRSNQQVMLGFRVLLHKFWFLTTMTMWFPFFKKRSPAEEKKRLLDECIRKTENYRKGLQDQEKPLLQEIKDNNQKGYKRIAMIVTTELVRIRDQIEKYNKWESQLHKLSLRIK